MRELSPSLSKSTQAHSPCGSLPSRKLIGLGVRCEIDKRNETIGYKLRNAQLEKLPYMLVVGAKEVESNTVAVRSRKEGEKGAMSPDQFISELLLEIAEKRR